MMIARQEELKAALAAGALKWSARLTLRLLSRGEHS